MIVRYVRVILNNKCNKKKDDIINASKAAAKRFILMQITAKAKAANGFP
jgi:hypothetical protein